MKTPFAHAIHILECIEKLEKLCEIDPQLENVFFYDAALRNLQTMAESTKFIDQK